MQVTRCNRCGKLVPDGKPAQTLYIYGQQMDLDPECWEAVTETDWKYPAIVPDPDDEPVLGQTSVQRADVTRPPVHGRPAAEIAADTLSGHGTPTAQA